MLADMSDADLRSLLHTRKWQIRRMKGRSPRMALWSRPFHLYWAVYDSDGKYLASARRPREAIVAAVRAEAPK